MGRTLVPPTLYVRYKTNGTTKERGIALCSMSKAVRAHTSLLAWPKCRRDASFYGTHGILPVRSQEQILVEGSHNNQHAIVTNKPKKITRADFWGVRPPV